MKVIIAGSRNIIDYSTVEHFIKLSKFKIDKIVSGEAKGVDLLGEQYAFKHNIPVERFPADWKNLGRPGAVIRRNSYGEYDASAGHYRNWQMAQYADALIAIWNGKSKGTANMIKHMKQLGKKYIVFEVV